MLAQNNSNRLTGYFRAFLDQTSPYNYQYDNVIQPDPSFFIYDTGNQLTFDNNPGYPSAYQQILNATNVIHPEIYTGIVNNNNVILTLNRDDLAIPPNNQQVDMFSRDVTGPDDHVAAAVPWVNTPVNGNLNFTRLRLSRSEGTQFKNFNLDINIDINLTAREVMNLVIENSTAFGVYTNIIDESNNVLQIQDSGTGPTVFNISIERPTISQPISKATVAQGAVLGTSETYVQDSISSDRWTRPVNTGVQID